MNSDTGHLVTGELWDQLKNLPGVRAYEELPRQYHEAARRKLAGAQEAYVARASGGKLSRFAAQRRKDKRREQRDSRRRNRG